MHNYVRIENGLVIDGVFESPVGPESREEETRWDIGIDGVFEFLLAQRTSLVNQAALKTHTHQCDKVMVLGNRGISLSLCFLTCTALGRLR